jgi:hypothetical protein
MTEADMQCIKHGLCEPGRHTREWPCDLAGESRGSISDVEWMPASSVPPQEKSEKKRHGRTSLLTVLALVLIGGLGYIGYVGYERNQEQKAEAAAVAAKKQAEKKRRAAIKHCEAEIGPFIDALRDIDASLDVGLNQGELSDMTAKASRAHARINDAGLSSRCDQALAAGESALDDYSSTASEWNDCIWGDSYYDECDPEYDLDLQGPWQDAAVSIDEALGLMSGEPVGHVS